MAGLPTTGRDPMNPYLATKGNDPAMQLVQLVIDWYRGHRNQINSTEADNVGTAIVAILKNTYNV